jgi:hypothetical protein
VSRDVTTQASDLDGAAAPRAFALARQQSDRFANALDLRAEACELHPRWRIVEAEQHRAFLDERTFARGDGEHAPLLLRVQRHGVSGHAHVAARVNGLLEWDKRQPAEGGEERECEEREEQ